MNRTLIPPPPRYAAVRQNPGGPLRISCVACSCDFELDSEHFAKQEHLKCPNCAQPFPDKELRQLMGVMDDIRSISEVCADSPTDNGFKISITNAGNTGELPF